VGFLLVGVQVPPPAPFKKSVITRHFIFSEVPFFISYILFVFAVFGHFLPEIAVPMAEIWQKYFHEQTHH
jgi:hypothetical protein